MFVALRHCCRLLGFRLAPSVTTADACLFAGRRHPPSFFLILLSWLATSAPPAAKESWLRKLPSLLGAADLSGRGGERVLAGFLWFVASRWSERISAVPQDLWGSALLSVKSMCAQGARLWVSYRKFPRPFVLTEMCYVWAFWMTDQNAFRVHLDDLLAKVSKDSGYGWREVGNAFALLPSDFLMQVALPPVARSSSSEHPYRVLSAKVMQRSGESGCLTKSDSELLARLRTAQAED